MEITNTSIEYLNTYLRVTITTDEPITLISVDGKAPANLSAEGDEVSFDYANAGATALLKMSAGGSIIEKRVKVMVPRGYYDPEVSDKTVRNELARTFWRALGDFWNLFEDKDIVNNLWGGYTNVIENIAAQLSQVRLSNSLKTATDYWSSRWERFDIPMDKEVIGSSHKAYDTYHPEFTVGMAIDESILCMPLLFNSAYKINMDLKAQLVYDSDFIVNNGYLLFKPADGISGSYWAPTLIRNREVSYRNFGYLINVEDEASYDYNNRIKALWFALWSGPTLFAINAAINMIMGYPYARGESRVSEIKIDNGLTKILLASGQEAEQSLEPCVSVGQYVKQFEPLFKTVSVMDRVSDPSWSNLKFTVSRIYFDSGNSFDTGALFDSNESVGSGKESIISKYHHFKVAVVHNESSMAPKNLQYIKFLLGTIKPCGVDFAIDVEDDITDIMETEDHQRIPEDGGMVVEMTFSIEDNVTEDYYHDNCYYDANYLNEVQR